MKPLVDALDLGIAGLKKHLESTTYSEADLRDTRKVLKEREKAVHRLTKTGMRGSFVEQPALASLPARTPAVSLKPGLAYVVSIQDNAVQIGKARLREVQQRANETIVVWEGIPPLYVAKSGMDVLFHAQPRQPEYFVLIPPGQKSIRGFPVGMFKR